MSGPLVPQRWTEPRLGDVNPLAADVAVSDANQSLVQNGLEFLGMLRRHLLVVLAVTFVAVGAMWYRMRHEQPSYQAGAVIRIADKGQALSGRLGGNPSEQMWRPYMDPVESQVQVLQSRRVAEKVVDSTGVRLRVVPEGKPPMWVSDVYIQRLAPSDTVRATFADNGFSLQGLGQSVHGTYNVPVELAGIRFTVPKRPPVQSVLLSAMPFDEAVTEVQNSVHGRPRERTDVVDVTYVANDPYLAQQVVNGTVSAFQAVSADIEKQESVRRRLFIQDQLTKAEQKYNEAQSAYNRFRARENVFSSQAKFKSQQEDLAGIELRRQELAADRQMYSSLVAVMDTSAGQHMSGERLAALASSPGVAANGVLSQLFSELSKLQNSRDSLTTGAWARTATNPDVKRLEALIGTTQSRISQATRGQIAFIDARLGALDELKKRVAGQMTTLPGLDAEETALSEQVKTYQREADQLRAELQSAQISEAAEAGQVDIVDLAVLPGSPIGSGRMPKLFFAVVIGLGLGSIAAYILENRRSVIRRRDDLERATTVPSLALVPQIRSIVAGKPGLITSSRSIGRRLLPMVGLSHANGHGNGNGSLSTVRPSELVTVSDARSSGAEAFRTLRTNLLFSAAVRSLHRIVITSPGPAEGKSTTAANLAIAFAQQGHRVLLVDCDLRRSRMHKVFNLPQTPGLTNILVGGLDPDGAVHSTEIDGLYVLPSGVLPPNPAELLGSAQMEHVLTALGLRYDLLILDSPPLLAASDAAILSKNADGALVIVRAGQTERNALNTAIQQLMTLGARVLGTVLNDPDAEIPKYAKYYGYYYNNYYDYSSTRA